MKYNNIYRQMRNLTIGLAGAALSLAAVSCNDMLDMAPQGQFTEENFDDETVEGLLAAAYGGLQSHFFGNNEAFAGPITNWIFDVRSDDALKGGGGPSMEGNIHQLEVGNVQSDNVSVFNKWENNSFAISRCNKAIKAVQNAENISNPESIIAELKTLRAYFYFDMVRIFKNIPYWTEETLDPAEVSPFEYSREQILEFIKKDLADAYQVLPASQSQPGRFNKYVAAAIHAKVSAFTSSWSEVMTYTGYVMAGPYELYPNFLDMSKLEFNNKYEAILQIQFSTANNNANINWCNLLNTTYSDGNLFGNGDDFFLASQDLVNAFATDEDGLPYLDGAPAGLTVESPMINPDYPGNVDPRLDFTVGRLGVPFRGYTYNMQWCRAYDVYGEYSGKKGLISPDSPDMVEGFPWGASSLGFNLIRYADILLLRAEAMIELGTDLEGARGLINQVRAKAKRSVDSNYTPVDVDPNQVWYLVEEYPQSSKWTQDYARKAVRMERRLELAMEGHRWFDLVRWGNVVEVMNKYYAKEVTYHTYYEGASLSQDNVLFPIPQGEVDKNPELYK